MIITFHSQYFFKVQAGDTVLSLNPLAAAKGKKVSKFGADLILQTTYDAEALQTNHYGDNEPVEIYGPGSYEIQGLQVEGFNVARDEHEPQHTTVFSFLFDDIRVGVLGDVDTKSALSPEALEALGESDLIFAPATEEGIELASSFSPHAIVLAGYDTSKDIASVTTGLSAEQHEMIEKLTIKKKDLSDKQSFVYVFNT